MSGKEFKTKRKTQEIIAESNVTLQQCLNLADKSRFIAGEAEEKFPGSLNDPADELPNGNTGVDLFAAEALVICVNSAPHEIQAMDRHLDEIPACLEAAVERKALLDRVITDHPLAVDVIVGDGELGNLTPEEAVKEVAKQTARECLER